MATAQALDSISDNAPALASPPLSGSPQADLGIKDDGPPADLVKGLTQLAKDKSATDARIAGTMAATYKTDRERLEAEYNAEQVRDVKPWNAEEESKKHSTDPVVAFASLGSVFGILASAFTHAPMENALNASAAAINAIKADDATEYKRAHDAWKENTDMAFKRADLEHRRFQDAATLMKENMSAGMEMARMNAIQSQDKKAALYLENGMVEEWQNFEIKKAELKAKTVEAALKQAKDMAIMQDRVDLIAKWKQDFKDKNGRDPTDVEKQMAMPSINRQWMQETSPYRQGTGINAMIEQRTQTYFEDPDSPTRGNIIASQDRALKEIKGESSTKKKTLAEEYTDKAVKEFKESHNGREPSAAEYKKIVEEAPKPQTVKQFSPSEAGHLAYAPTLMRDLQVLDAFMDSSTGVFTGVMKQFAGEYIGVNDPVQLWQAAKKSADAAAAAMSQQGSKSAIALKAQLDTLPETPRASSFGHKQVQLKMGELRDETQSFVNTMEAGGKKIDPDNLERMGKIGVFPESTKGKNPLLKLQKDPTSVSDDELKNLNRLKGSYPLETQQKISAEVKRRYDEWNKQHQGTVP